MMRTEMRTGFSTEILVESGFKVVGIDILYDMLSKGITKKINMVNQSKIESIKL